MRLLTAVPICDGHDSAITTINLELIRHGVEVIYLGYHRSARDIARAAVQEDVRAIGISSYNGGHVEFFAEVADQLRQFGAPDIGIFGGGGGTISQADEIIMRRHGVDRIFFPGAPLAEIVSFVQEKYGSAPQRGKSSPKAFDRGLARLLTEAESSGKRSRRGDFKSRRALRGTGVSPVSLRLEHGRDARATFALASEASIVHAPRVIGIAGPGGAGKTTLIDELILRFRQSRPDSRVAVLSHDPSLPGRGALLGDRAAMIHSQADTVFMRSLATRGRAGGLAPGTERCLDLLRSLESDGSCVFELILIETVGTGQEAAPFPRRMVDRSVLVMSPDYGARLQLQKIVMLDEADIVVVNKSDQPGASTASSEIQSRLSGHNRGQKLIATCANRHRDAGVDELFGMLIN